jgi:uncharacterized protein (TIGR02996 family)
VEPLPPEARPFLDALAENPADELSRLALADWLEERGDRRAAWVRDADLWEYMRPDARDPVRGILGEVLAPGMTGHLLALLARIGPPAVPAVRAWVREDPDTRFLPTLGYLVTARPPALAPLGALLEQLATGSWYEEWEAVTDLGFHGPAAAIAVPALLRATEHPQRHDKWEEIFDEWFHADGGSTADDSSPLESALCRTFAAIGPAAREAAVWLAESAHVLGAAYPALRQIRPDPVLVLNHLNTDQKEDVRIGVRLVRDIDPTGTAALIHAVQNLSGYLRDCSAETLGEMGAAAADALPALRETLQRLESAAGWLDREVSGRYVRQAIERIEAGGISRPA